MEYSIKPEEHELKKSRNSIDRVLSSYGYSFDVENLEFYLNWQKLDKAATYTYDDKNAITLIIDPDKDWEEKLETSVLRGVSQAEFMHLSEIEEMRFNWQEVLRFAYTKMKMTEIAGEETSEKEELKEKWAELKEQLSKEISAQNFDEFFYMNAGVLGGMIGQKLLEDYELEEFPELKRSDVIEAGDELFGEK